MTNQILTRTNEAFKSIFKSRTTLYALLAIFFIWPFVVGNSYYLHVAVIMLLGAITAVAFNIFFGYMGQINFGPISWYGIGAYAAALVEMKLGVPWIPAVFIVAPLAAGIISWVLSFPLLRLHGHGMALGTFAFVIITYLVLERWTDFTGGGDGMLVAAPTIFDYNLRSGPGLYFIVLIVAILVFILFHRLISSRHGRAIKAIRTDEVGAAAVGINVMRYKRVIFVLSCTIIGLAGGLVSQEAGRLGPDYASPAANVLVILMLVTGGRRSNAGQVIGGFFISVLPVLLADFVDLSIVIYSVIILLMMIFMPDGIVGVIRNWLRLRVSR